MLGKACLSNIYLYQLPARQCCQRLTKIFGQINKKIGRWRKYFAAHIFPIEAYITAFNSLFPSPVDEIMYSVDI
jgi:hypothetical protein